MDDPTMVRPEKTLKVGPWSVAGSSEESKLVTLVELVQKHLYVRHTNVPEVGTNRNTGCRASL